MKNVPFKLLQHITARITNEVAGVDRVLFDLTPKLNVHPSVETCCIADVKTMADLLIAILEDITKIIGFLFQIILCVRHKMTVIKSNERL